MNHLVRLFRDGPDKFRIIMAQYVDGDAAEEIEIFLAVDIPEVSALAMVQHDVVALEHGYIGCLVFGKYFFV